MKKSTYNFLAFIIIPLITVAVAMILMFIWHSVLWENTVNSGLVTEKSLKTQLWHIMDIYDIETAYVIYGINDYDISDDEYCIAVQGSSVKSIDKIVQDSHVGGYAESYFKDKEVYYVKDMTIFNSVQEYINEKRNQKRSKFNNETCQYEEYKAEEYDEYIYKLTKSPENVRVYDISDYLGYDEDYNNGKSLAEYIVYFVIGIFLIITLFVELIISIIIKEKFKYKLVQ